MKVSLLTPRQDGSLLIQAEDGRIGVFDVKPYLDDDAFSLLRTPEEFSKVTNHGYFVEWQCGADLSADTLEARWVVQQPSASLAA